MFSRLEDCNGLAKTKNNFLKLKTMTGFFFLFGMWMMIIIPMAYYLFTDKN